MKAKKLLIYTIFAIIMSSIIFAEDLALIVNSDTFIDPIYEQQVKDVLENMTSRIDNSTFNVTLIDWHNTSPINFSKFDAIIIAGRPGASDADTYDPEFLDFLKSINVNDYKTLAIQGRNLNAWGWANLSSTALIQHPTQDIYLVNHSITEPLPNIVDPYGNCSTMTPLLIKLEKDSTTLNPIAKAMDPFNYPLVFNNSYIISIAEPNTTLLYNFTTKERIVHFGVAYSKCWNQNGTILFRESVYWLLYGDDMDEDGVNDSDDNCPIVPNGPELGTCIGGFGGGNECQTSLECGGGFCNKNQEDADSDGDGDACDAPTAYTVTKSTYEDASTTVELLCTDPDNEAVQFEILTYTINGVLSGNTSPRTYMPNLDYTGIDNFTYKCNDGYVDSNTAYGFITVIPVNDAPIAYPVATSTYEDASGSIQLDCFDIDGDNLTYTIATTTMFGILDIDNNTGLGNYTPNPNSTQLDNFTYFCDDGQTISNIASGTITIIPVNDAPVAYNVQDIVIEDINATIELNCSDIDGDNLIYIIASGTANGVLYINSTTGIGIYDPDQNYFGLDNFTYFCNDSNEISNTATGTIIILGLNDAPIANDDTYNVDEDNTLNISAPGILSNDYDADPDNLTAILVSDVSNGTLTLFANGSFIYVPSPDFNGNDSFTYVANDTAYISGITTVTIIVAPVNDPPVVQSVTLTNGYVGDTIIANCSATDIDSDLGDLIYYYQFRNLNHTPPIRQNYSTDNTYLVSQFDAHDTIEVECKASDQIDNSTNTKTKTVTILNSLPIANNFNNETEEDNSTNITLICSDIDGDNLTYTVASTTILGTLLIDPNTGTGNYTPDQDEFGIDNFTYYCNDGLSNSNLANGSINVTPVKDAPVAYGDVKVTDEDTSIGIELNCSDVDSTLLIYIIATEPAHGTFVFDNTTGVGTYTPSQDYNGLDNFTFYCDDLDPISNNAQVNITINPVNDAPIAENVDVNVTEDKNVTFQLNCSDVDGPNMTYVIASTTINGGLVLVNETTGLVIYTPNGNYSGNDSFIYYCNDSINNSNLANGSINVTPVNDAPVAYGDVKVTDEDTLIGIELNCTDVDSTLLIYNIATEPAHGTLLIDNTTGIGNYTPDQDYNGLDNFIFYCDDLNLISNNAQVNITINSVNDTPVAYGVATSTLENTPTTIELNCSDVDGDNLTYTVASTTPNGVLDINTITGIGNYTPNTNYSGNDTFIYFCNDGDNNSNNATGTFEVLEVACITNVDCGAEASYNFCDVLNYNTNTTTPTCVNPATATSYCEDVSVINLNDTCNNICDDTLACDYTECSDSDDNDGDNYTDFPDDLGCNNYTDDNESDGFVRCDTNADCGSIFMDQYCDNLSYNTNTTTPTCYLATTEHSYCQNDSVETINDTCNNICDDTLACDYTECSDSADNDNDTYIDFPDDIGCDNYTDDNESIPIICTTNTDCGVINVTEWCDSDTIYTTATTTPTCYLAGTESSYCQDDVVESNETCNNICDDSLGCDYTECSDGQDNDSDTYIDYPLDLGCDNFTDDDESDGFVRCDTNADCGSVFMDQYCSGDNSSYLTNETTPTCYLSGTEQSYCQNDSVETINDTCNYICDDTLACDYTECSDGQDNDSDTYIDYPLDIGCDNYTDDNESIPINCTTNADCGAEASYNFCDVLNYNTNTTTPTCQNAGTESSYCEDISIVSLNDTCNNICDDTLACDYTECSDGDDNDNDTFIDFPDDIGCDNYTDDNESIPIICTTNTDCGVINVTEWCDSDTIYTTATTTPTCYLAGTESSYCQDDVVESNETCNNICDDSLGCDYTECSNSQEDDGDGYIDYPLDLGCDNFTDDDESDGFVMCAIDNDCGVETVEYFCESLGQYSNTTTPTCYVAGTEHSYCQDDSVVALEEQCNNICDPLIGCDYTECSNGVEDDGDGYIDYPLDLGCDNFTDDDESDGPVTCTTNLDCGTPITIGACECIDNCVQGVAYVSDTTTPTCNLEGTEHSFCTNETTQDNETCDYICSDSLGCDYTECTDGLDNDNDTYIDFSDDLGCEHYFDDNEGDGAVRCNSNLDCGAPTSQTSCDNSTFTTNDTTPTCYLTGSEFSFCLNESIETNDNCNHLCDNDQGCDYTECSDGTDNDGDNQTDYPYDTECDNYLDDSESPGTIACNNNSDCGTPYNSQYCNGLNYVTNDTTPTCNLAGTENSYCSDESITQEDSCNYLCDNTTGCDYTECSNGIDDDIDGFIDYPLDLGCENYLDNNENDGSIECNANSDCGTAFAVQYCDNSSHVINTTTPTCYNSGTEHSFCTNESITQGTLCNYICDNALGCDYTQCSDSLDNDNDTFIDFPVDLGCIDYFDNSEGDGVIACYNNSDCGAQTNVGYCDNLTFVADLTTPTCYYPATEYSQCVSLLTPTNETCNYLCDNSSGCDYTECSDGIDNDNDGYIDYPFDSGCTDYLDNRESTQEIVEPTVEKLDADMVIERISISGDSTVQVGDSITFFLEFRNRGDIDLNNVRVQIGIPELGVSRRIGPMNVNEGSTIAEQTTIYIPYGTLPGEYLARIVVYDEEAKRVQHRYIWVYE